MSLPNDKIIINDGILYYNDNKNEIIHTPTDGEIVIYYKNIFTKGYTYTFDNQKIYNSRTDLFNVECMNFQTLNIIPIYCQCLSYCTQGSLTVTSTDEDNGFYIDGQYSNANQLLFGMVRIEKSDTSWGFDTNYVKSPYVFIFDSDGAYVNFNSSKQYNNINNITYSLKMQSRATPYSTLSGLLNMDIFINVITIGIIA